MYTATFRQQYKPPTKALNRKGDSELILTFCDTGTSFTFACSRKKRKVGCEEGLSADKRSITLPFLWVDPNCFIDTHSAPVKTSTIIRRILVSGPFLGCYCNYIPNERKEWDQYTGPFNLSTCPVFFLLNRLTRYLQVAFLPCWQQIRQSWCKAIVVKWLNGVIDEMGRERTEK